MMRSGPNQRLSANKAHLGRINGNTLAIADDYFGLSNDARRENRRTFWFFAKSRSRRARRIALELDGRATDCWRELLLRFRPLVSNCFQASGLTQDAAGGYSAAIPSFTRRFEILAQRTTGRPCFAEILWRAVGDSVPGGKAAIAEYHERFHLLALLDEFDSVHQGTIRTEYFYQDGSVWAAANAGPNIDLRVADLYKALAAYAGFLCGLDRELERLTDGVITHAMLKIGSPADVLLAWL